MPLLLKEASCADTPEPVLNRIIDLIKAIEQRESYIALMLENPSILSHLIKLADASDWIIDYLARHPVLLDELIDSRSLYATPDREFLESELKNKQAMLSGDDMEDQIEQLCVFKQANVLRIAAADVTGILPVMKVSDHLSYVAEVILKAVFDLSWDFLTDKHGMPEYEPGDKACGRGFLIVALGKLGGIELGYNSDIDLVFIHAAKQGKTSGANNPIENSYFYTRIGQRIVHMLTSHTRAGILYETDMRLRPSGNTGPLVSHIEAFFEYQIKEGWTWEHQALVRARPIIGDPELAKRFVHGRRNVLGIFREEKKLKAEIREMRSRVLSNRLNINNELFDLKEDVGGIIDIEFLVQYLVLLKSHQYEELLEWTDNIRTIETLSELGIIDFAAKEILTNAYLTFRTQIHKMRLQRKPPMVDTGRFENLRSDVIKIWNNFLN
jgi:glutamate-ammonia-ligase adenylyltransferase